MFIGSVWTNEPADGHTHLWVVDAPVPIPLPPIPFFLPVGAIHAMHSVGLLDERAASAGGVAGVWIVCK